MSGRKDQSQRVFTLCVRALCQPYSLCVLLLDLRVLKVAPFYFSGLRAEAPSCG